MTEVNSPTLVPKNIELLKAYVPGKTIAEVIEQYRPSRISKLASNENRMGRSSEVDQAVAEALKTVHDYPDPQARKLRSAVGAHLSKTTDRILIGAGSESLLAGIFRTFFLNKQNMVTADATFVGAFIQAQIRGINVKKIPLTTHYRFDVRAMVNAIDEHTKVIYIANPNNPTGTYINKQEFEWLMAEVPQHILVVMDEAYFEYAQATEDYPDSLSYQHENLIVLRTFSKSYGLAGFRVGYAIARPEIITMMAKTRLTFEPGALAQAAAFAALGDQEFLENSIDVVQRAKQELYTFFENKGVKYAQSAANFIMIELKDEETAVHFTQKMLEAGVILRHIGSFGLPKCVRITLGLPEEMEHFKEQFTNII
jgi:histidinol-phosphate aminotransferase